MPERRTRLTIEGRPLNRLAEAIQSSNGLPPVDQWNPDHCGDSDMRIAADGTWFHQGSPIPRDAMVRLFSTVLRREADGSHVLVTPVEKLAIDVERTPFRAIAMKVEGEGEDRNIAFDIDHADAVIAGPDHPITLVETDHGPSPRVLVRGGLEAELQRGVYYELAELALQNSPAGVWSGGTFFKLGA